MKHFKRIPKVWRAVALVAIGAVVFLAGLYMLTGLAVTLLAGGAGLVAAGLVVDT